MPSPSVQSPATNTSPANAVPGTGVDSATTTAQPSVQGAMSTSSGPAPQAIDPQKPDPVAIVETDKGTITIRLFRQLAPRTVANLLI